jgi:peptide/nickel transport system substrate-binding protein
MKLAIALTLCALFTGIRPLEGASALAPQPLRPGEEVLITQGEVGRSGGRLVASLRSEPKTLNPVTALDLPSKQVIGLMAADLIHINRLTQRTEPALAKSWKVSADGRRYILQLRHGLRFSDGHPFDADDVVFSFQVFLDERAHSAQRDLLTVGGKPVTVRKIDAYTVQFELAQPDAAAERLFDSVAILPQHLLQKSFQEGKIPEAWNLTTPPAQIAGLGPFRLKEYVPGQRIVLERNPNYWKASQGSQRLPYLDEIVFLVVPSEDAQVVRFEAGDIDVISPLSAENFSVLAKDQQVRGYKLYDVGPGLQYEFLFFNLNDAAPKDPQSIAPKREWFRQVSFRQAVSAAIDREGIVRLVYQGRATSLWEQVTPGNKLWMNPAIPHPAQSLPKARELLKAANFSWKDDGTLVDSHGRTVEFTIIVNPGNAQRMKIATITQDDLSQLGMRVHVAPLEFGALMNRIFETFDYEACVLGLLASDADPNPEGGVWLRDGSMHVWDLRRTSPPAAWEAEIDRLMREQLTTLNYQSRKRLYDRVQQLVAENLPLICLVSPNILVGAKKNLGNFQPANLTDYTLWNAEELFFRHEESGKSR